MPPSRPPSPLPAPARPALPPTDLALLAVAVAGISLSAPLIAATAAPALAVAFWRNAMAVGVLAPLALLRHRAELRALPRRTLALSAASGLLLALHFGLWLPSLHLTSVASSTALVTTTPVWTLLILRLRGRRPPRAAVVGALVACSGVLLLTGVDLGVGRDALLGDALALGGGVAGAGYLLLGEEVRRTAGTTVHTLICYTVTALALLAVCLAAGQALAGYQSGTWWKLLALTACAQFAGHSLVNRAVRGLGASVTSTALLLETPGAALVAALWLGQVPPAATWPALVVILAGLVLVIRGTTAVGPGRLRKDSAAVRSAAAPRPVPDRSRNG